ncbi:DUF226 domain-containing protein [Borreliella burgdorferi]|uniref:Borrelia family protein n=2 Tax=Borreliella burgdorferi TaxID=139 RepID=A0A7U4DJ01_BORBG|nr:DUF226 domain-containing protein [Borreliella burgdorferi]ACL33735.1 conserved hypothetical protein [Borreliella burgdorferi 156a]ACN55485.1 conserved hypothetical protein [Borreliella burgdorferi WI91-23]ACN92531.1 conserved hypothetical protein [Borreliella burgdorferi 94a]ACN93068.1 conserved hypothetical protein [Borreliella burgdorferi 118a]ACO38183.1 conserved hypothetical protein [Borreliella burgdorferi 29805]
MSKLLEKLKQKKTLMKIDNILIKKDIFSKIEEIDGKKVYYTKIFKHLIDFKVTNKEQRLRLVFQEFNNNNKDYYFFNLFSLGKNDKFLGIKYGWDHLEKPFFLKKEDNKIYAIKKLYYIEFRFKKGSVKSYILSLRTLLRKNEKESTEYYQFTLNHLEKMESKVYKFYNKKSPDGGILKKWILKNQIL